MHKRNESEGILEAPSPIIPMYRPTSQSSKRTNYTMSALAPKYQQYLSMADDIHSTGATNAQPSNENVTDIVRFLQSHVTSQAPSTGTKDMIKAGQRRLKLALRNKKGTDLKAKGEDTARQLVALQNQGSFPRSQYRKWGHKRSVASTTSSSKSISDLSFKSSSRRDVETIGQPWLENPLESRDAPGSKASSQLSSLDLRDLASFVEAAVNFSQFEDSNPPPYQPPTEQPVKPTESTTSAAEHMSRPGTTPRSIMKASGLSMEDLGHTPSNELPIGSRTNHPARLRISNDKQDFGIQPLESKPKAASTVAATPPPSSSSASPKRSSAPTTPILKLFPDVMAPHPSSKKALRIPTGRSPTSNRFGSPVPTSQNTTALPAVFESDNRGSRNSSSSLPKIRENNPDTRETKQPPSTGSERPSASAEVSLRPEDQQAKHNRRPSSLPPGAIYAFPIPAPSRPLPSVPEPIPGEQNSPMDQQLDQLDMGHPVPDTPKSSPPNISVSPPSSPRDSNGSSRGRDSPFLKLATGSRDPATTHNTVVGSPISVQPRRGSLGKVGRSREAKVRSLIMKDIAASRYQKNPSKNQVIETRPEPYRDNQLSPPQRDEDSRPRARRQYQRKVSPGPSSPPPMSPPPSNPPRHALHGRRYCTSPASTMAAAIENFESLSRPTPNRNHRVSRKNNSRGVEVKPERESMERNLPDRLETPLPSSDDEGPAGDFYWNSPHRTTGRGRRWGPAPIVIDEPSSDRGRSLKQHQATGSMSPPTQQSYRRRGLENISRQHLSPNDYQPQEPQSHHAPEAKSNPSLEGRIEHLERQNRILQAALLAALDVGVKQDLSSLLAASATSTTTPPLTGRSSSSTTNTSTSETHSVGRDRYTRDRKVPYCPESWIASPDSFNKGSYDGDRGTQTRELEEMMDEFNLDWLSDRSSIMS
ncbi:hypothetical protein BJX76DRAFT_355605 [Aspergillus varians]